MSNALMPFSWQASQWLELQNRLKCNQFPHALLLTGLAGLGKLHFAYCLGHSLLCSQREPEGGACGHCRQCELLQAGNHPDLLIIRPEESTHTIKIEQIRAVS